MTERKTRKPSVYIKRIGGRVALRHMGHTIWLSRDQAATICDALMAWLNGQLDRDIEAFERGLSQETT